MADSTPIVSVIIPAYNARNYISEAIASVQNQTLSHWELIVVNDGSTDETEAIVTLLCKRDPRIRLITQPNGKLAKARNTGIGAASGEFIAFLDADDLWEPTKLERQIRVCHDTGADVVFTDAFHFPESSPDLPVHLFGKWVGLFPGSLMFKNLYSGNAIPVSSVLLRRNRLADDGRFDEGLAYLEDCEMWLRLSSHGASFFGINEKLIGYRSHNLQMSRDILPMLRSEVAVRKKYRSIAKEQGVDLCKQDRLDHSAMAYCSANVGEYKLAYSAILKLLDLKKFGARGVKNAIGAALHLFYHILCGPAIASGLPENCLQKS